MIPVELGNRGVVLSYTVLELPPEGFESPLLLVLVEIENGAVVLALGDKTDIADIQLGSNVEIHLDEEERFHLRLEPG